MSQVRDSLADEDHLALEISDFSPRNHSRKVTTNTNTTIASKRQRKRNPKRLAIMIFLFQVCLIAGIVILVRRITRNKRESSPTTSTSNNALEDSDTTDGEKSDATHTSSSSPPTPVPTSPPTVAAQVFQAEDGQPLSRFDQLRTLLRPISTLEALNDSSSPQYRAVDWLAHDDPAMLDVTTNFVTLSERYIVAVLYFATNGAEWRKQHGFLSGMSICGWNDGGAGQAFEGIKCNGGNRVVEIVLAFNFLEGFIPPELGHLSYVEILGFGANYLTGNVPSTLGNMSNLKQLNLVENELFGPLPDELGNLNNLEQLFIYNNNLEGPLPASFVSLNKLDQVFMEGNDFTGDFGLTMCTSGAPMTMFYADCGGSTPDVTCSCCTHCCDSSGKSCQAL